MVNRWSASVEGIGGTVACIPGVRTDSVAGQVTINIPSRVSRHPCYGARRQPVGKVIGRAGDGGWQNRLEQGAASRGDTPGQIISIGQRTKRRSPTGVSNAG